MIQIRTSFLNLVKQNKQKSVDIDKEDNIQGLRKIRYNIKNFDQERVRNLYQNRLNTKLNRKRRKTKAYW